MPFPIRPRSHPIPARSAQGRMSRWIIVLSFLAGLGGPCTAGAQKSAAPEPVPVTAAEKKALLPVPAPNLDRQEETVKKRMEAARADFVALRSDPEVTVLALGEAHGELGRIYHAHRLYAAAEACYRNAEKLLPKDTRWPYLLGYLHQEQARLDEATGDYRRTLALYPNYTPAQIRLAQTLLGTGHAIEAVPLLERAVEIPEFQGAAAFWLGKAALSEGQHARALQWLKQALDARPEASRIHYSLAMAYRGLGDVDAARGHLRERGDIDPPIPDPMVEELAELLTGTRTRQYHAMVAIWSRQFDVAAEEFQVILASEPSNIQARVSLGRCLYLLGKQDLAKKELGIALKKDPVHDKANYFMGRLLREEGRSEDAMAHFKTALDTDPEHAGARFFLAEGAMRQGDFRQAAYHFAKVVEALPEDLVARQREVIALVGTGPEAHGKALGRIAEALQIYPDDAVLTGQLARVLAGSDDPDARDGKRALALAEGLFEQDQSIENAELVAMAHAELGQFERAVAYQQSAIDALAAYGYQYGGVGVFERLMTHLEFYRENRPYRIPAASRS